MGDVVKKGNYLTWFGEIRLLKRAESGLIWGTGDHRDTLTAMGNLRVMYWTMGKREDVAELRMKVYDGWKRIRGTRHPDTLTAMANLAPTYGDRGDWNKAVRLEEEVLKSSKSVRAKSNPDTLAAMGNLAVTYGNLGMWNAAVKLEGKS